MKHKGILLKQQLHQIDCKSNRDVTAFFAILIVFYLGGGGGLLQKSDHQRGAYKREGLNREGGGGLKELLRYPYVHLSERLY